MPPRVLLDPTHLRQCGAIHALRAQHIDVVLLGQLFGRETLGGAVDHVAGVVNDDVNPASGRHDRRDRGRHGRLTGDVQFDRPDVDAMLPRKRFDVGGLARVAPRSVAHAGKHHVSGLCQRVRRHAAEAAR